MSNPLTEKERRSIVARIEAGDGRNEIARAFRRAPATVTKVAREAGLAHAFDRSATREATAARKADLEAHRARLAAGLLEDVERFRGRLHDPEATSTDVRNLMVGAGIALDHHMKLTNFDRPADPHNAAEVDRWLLVMMGKDPDGASKGEK